jgi:hypothetical protein
MHPQPNQAALFKVSPRMKKANIAANTGSMV